MTRGRGFFSLFSLRLSSPSHGVWDGFSLGCFALEAVSLSQSPLEDLPMANLLLHCGGKHVTRDDLVLAPTPSRTRSWVPVAHHRLIDTVEQTVKRQGFRVTNQAHGLWGDGARYFGLMELANDVAAHQLVADDSDDFSSADHDISNPGSADHSTADYSLVVGIRNSHDKTFPASLALGSQVLVCDNLSFFGEVVIARRHTRFIERDLPGIVATAVGRLTEMRSRQADRITAYKQKQIRDRTVHDVVVQAVDSRIIPVTQLPLVIKEWRAPSHDAFLEDGRSVWRLFNAFTESFKTRSLEMLPQRSQALHGLLDRVCQLAV
jgi:hypothetical protein